MARPLSPEKQQALLQAAALAVAEQGVLATTSSIAKRAGVAEGTLFTYFENKDALLQAVYLHLKQGLCDSLMPAYPHEADHRQRLEHVFQGYVGWGLAYPDGRSAVARLAASGLIAEDTRNQAGEPFLAIYQMLEDAVQQRVLVQAPIAFLSSMIERIADITIEYIGLHPDEAKHYRELGFGMLWKALRF